MSLPNIPMSNWRRGAHLCEILRFYISNLWKQMNFFRWCFTFSLKIQVVTAKLFLFLTEHYPETERVLMFFAAGAKLCCFFSPKPQNWVSFLANVPLFIQQVSNDWMSVIYLMRRIKILEQCRETLCIHISKLDMCLRMSGMKTAQSSLLNSSWAVHSLYQVPT